MKKIISLTIVFMLLLTTPVMASELTWEEAPGHHNLSNLLSSSVITSSDVVERNARGEILSMGMVEITNEQNGEIFVRIGTYAHRNVDRIHHAVFLDEWDDEEQDWSQVGYWEFDKTKDEEENGELSELVTSFTLSGYTVNRYYRVRGLHMVELGDEMEGCASETDGILITNN